MRFNAFMAYADTLPPQRKFGQTTRPDVWWAQPLAIFIGLSTFIVYSTWAALQGDHYWVAAGGADYLSPFYSPEFWGKSPHAWFGPRPGWWPAWLIFSPALLVLWAPAGFRLTCYYYRGAYYKAFWADPVSCAVGEPRKSYLGEKYLPLILQNAHRYFLYLALIFLLVLASDAWRGMWFTGADGAAHFGLGVGTLVLMLNVFFLGGYTFGCHSLRHLIGGFLDAPSKAPACAKGYACVTCLNKKHMLWAWMSLFWVGFTDLYIRLCSLGIWHDARIF
jgi:hypothetical protein